MFKPTHIFHYAENTVSKKMFPKGVPVMKGYVDEDGLIEWLADDHLNVAGYSTEGDSFVVPIAKEHQK